MKKILIILFFIFILNFISCKKEETSYVKIGEVNMLQILTDISPKLNLHIYTTLDKEIEYIPNILVEKYLLKKIKTDIDNNQKIYELLIIFKNQEFKITTLSFKENDIETKYVIGTYQTIRIKQENESISSVVNVINKHTNKCDLNITIFNNFKEPIYLDTIYTYKKNQSYGININKIDPYLTCVLVDNFKLYNHISLTNDFEYEQISGILVFKYLTSLEEHIIYVNYYVNFNNKYTLHI